MDFPLYLSSDCTMLSSNHVIVTSSQETSPSLPQTVVILPPGTTFQLNPQSHLSSGPTPSSPRPLRHVLPKPLASATFQRAPAPLPTPPSKSSSSLVSSSNPSIGSSISSVKFCFPDTKKPPLILSDLNKFPSTSQHVKSDRRNFQFTSSTSKLSPEPTPLSFTQTSSHVAHTSKLSPESPPLSFTKPISHVVPSSDPLLISSTVSQVPNLSTRMILRKFLSCKRKRASLAKPWRSQVTALVRRSIT